MSRISIYLSSYNHAKYLGKAITSVLDQTFVDYELFIVDDASTDESWSIIQSFTDPRIHSFRNITNLNDKERMREIVLQMATGEYIAVHHSDNVWEPEKLQRQVDFLDAHPDIGAVFTNAQIIDEDGEPLRDESHFYYKVFDQPNRSRYEWLNFFFYQGNALCHPSVLIRKKCYEECGFYRNGFAQIPDLDMWVRLCIKYEIHVMPEKLVRYRVRSDEMYASGSRPETQTRARFEYLQVLGHYLKITTVDDLVKIFPAARKYDRPDGFDIGYILGMLALEAPVYRPWLHLFGLELLFKAINDPDRARKISQLYGFAHKDFIALTATHEIFSLEETANLNKQLSEVKNSAIWSLGMRVRAIRLWLAPPSSRRDRLIRLVLRKLMEWHKAPSRR